MSITDNLGGHLMLPGDRLASRLAEERRRLVIHLTCKDLNRSGLESGAWRYAAGGVITSSR